MKAKKIAFPFFLTALFLGQLVFYCGCSNSAANTDSTPVAPAPAVDAKLKLLIENYRSFFIQTMQETQTPGAAVAIVKGDSVIFLEGFGVRDTKSQTPVDVHTVFRIGSLSKGFAGILTGILVQDGMMEWNQTVQDCYPGFVLRDEEQASRMQIKHLLSHTTGLPYHAFTNLIEMGYDTRRIVENYFPRAPLSGREGEVFSYQNAAFCVIEPVMEASAHQTYDELLSGRIFKPAHMVDASCNFQSMQQSENKCLPHFWTGNYFNPEPISNLYYNSAAAGGVNASISDMGNWLRLLLGHKPHIIADSTLDQVFKPMIDTGKERRILGKWIDRDKAFYAMGWRVLEHGADTIIYHGGYVNGFRGEIAFNRKENIGICVLMNASSALSGNCITTFFDFWQTLGIEN